MTGVSRRTLLRGLAGGVTGPLLLRAALPVTVLSLAAACAASRDTVQIAVVWSGRELEMFRRVLYTWKDRPQIQLISVGNGIESLLTSRIDAGNPPDIAVLPQPGILKRLKSLTPLDTGLAQWPDEPWRSLLTVKSELYGVWLKTTHKSVFWHRRSESFGEGYQPDRLRKDLQKSALATHGPLGIGAADGWVLTDWFENALLGTDPNIYEALAGGDGTKWQSEAVQTALTWLGELWGIDDVLTNGAERALLTQYDEAAVQVLGGPRGDGLTFEGDFLAPALAPYQREGLVDVRLETFRFPILNREVSPPLVVGGDFAVLLNPDETSPARDVVEWLASPDAAHRFAEYGFLTLHEDATEADYLKLVPGGVHPDSNLPDLFKDLASQLRDHKDSKVEFDLSDQLTGRLAGGDGQGIWLLLQKFFAEVTRSGANVAAAVQRTQEALVGAAGEAQD